MLGKLYETGHIHHFRNLKATAQRGHFVFCHAQIHPHKPVGEHSIDEVIRGREINRYHGAFHDGNVVVYGHSSRKTGANQPYSIGIDPRAVQNRQPLVFTLDGQSAVTLLRSTQAWDIPVNYQRGPREETPRPYSANGKAHKPMAAAAHATTSRSATSDQPSKKERKAKAREAIRAQEEALKKRPKSSPQLATKSLDA